MKRTLATSAAALLLMSGAAFAGPTVMSDEQMDNLVAGVAIANIETKSGKTVWSVFSLTPTGENNGGNGNTAKTAPGLLNAAGNPLGDTGRPGKGKGLVLNLL